MDKKFVIMNCKIRVLLLIIKYNKNFRFTSTKVLAATPTLAMKEYYYLEYDYISDY